MDRPEPTRLVSLLGCVAFCAGLAGCQRAEPAPTKAITASPVEAPPESAPVAPAPRPAPDESSAPGPTPAPAAPLTARGDAQPPLRSVLVLGDSLSDEKVGGGGFVKLLRKRCPGVAFDNRAKGGFMVNQMRRKLEGEILPEGGRYTHAIVFGGVNDLYSDQTANRSLSRIQNDLERIYENLRQRGVSVIAITVAPWGGFKPWYTPARGATTRALNAWIVDQAARGNVTEALDLYPLLSCGEPELLCPRFSPPHGDGLHFGKLGHEVLEGALAQTAFRACGSA
jgi:lysophospholipase L1-like esterase